MNSVRGRAESGGGKMLEAGKELDLHPIHEEELQVEEACENELESNREKIQNIR